MHQVASGSMDAVVCTLVLCSDPDDALVAGGAASDWEVALPHGRDSLRDPAHWTSGWLGWVHSLAAE